MTPKRKKRMILIGLMVAGVAVAIGFALKAFNENLMFFYTPTAVAAGAEQRAAPVQLGQFCDLGAERLPKRGAAFPTLSGGFLHDEVSLLTSSGAFLKPRVSLLFVSGTLLHT